MHMDASTTWQAFLTSTASLEVAQSTDTAGSTLLCPLPDYAVLEVVGPDSARFLQGQLTCNLDKLDGDHGMPGAQCSVKGRVLTSFLLGQPEPERYWLRLRRDLLEPIAALLGKYIVFSKARLVPQPDLLVVGLQGIKSADLLSRLGATPAGAHATRAIADGLSYQRDTAGHRFECWLPVEGAQSLLAQAQQLGVELGTEAAWALQDIIAGEVDVGAAATDQFLPQMLNYDLTDRVHFDKGCYTGQEIVARAHYRGQVKRRMGRYAVATPTPPSMGAAVLGENGREIGTVVAAATAGDGASELLAVTSDPGDQQLQLDNLPLRAIPLPYAIS